MNILVRLPLQLKNSTSVLDINQRCLYFQVHESSFTFHDRGQIEHEMKKRQRVEQEKESLVNTH